MSTTTETAVRYERDEDGIVTLTLDDPTASANTMNEIYQRSMAAAVDRLHDEQDQVTGVVVASAISRPPPRAAPLIAATTGRG